MQQVELEVSVGDILRIGEHLVTIIEIHRGEATFKIVTAPLATEGEAEPVLKPR